ncbi:LPXTG cell wall anchor domain-containing protein [Enterococcus termitis]
MVTQTTNIAKENIKNLKNTPLPQIPGYPISIYSWLKDNFRQSSEYSGVIVGQNPDIVIQFPEFTMETITTKLDSLEIYKITAPDIPPVPDMPEAPKQVEVDLAAPQIVTPVQEPVNPSIEPTALSTKVLTDVANVDLPMLTTAQPSTPTQPVEDIDNTEPVTDIDFDSEEATGSVQPEAPTELGDLENVTEVDPLEKPTEIEEAPEVVAPATPEVTAPEVVEEAEQPVEKVIDLTAPTDPKKTEAAKVNTVPTAPLTLAKPTEKAQDPAGTTVTTTRSAIRTKTDPSSSTLPTTRSQRTLPNTGAETSATAQSMGVLMAGAAGSLLFWKRRKGKHEK